jgi:plastocyanin
MKTTLVTIACLLGNTSAASTVDIAWKIPMNPQKITANTGDTLKFIWSGGHNVYKMASMQAYDDCNFVGATNAGATSPVEVTMGDATVYYACEVSGHCSANQKIEISVGTATTSTPSSSTTDKKKTPTKSPSPKTSGGASSDTQSLLTCAAGAAVATALLLM